MACSACLSTPPDTAGVTRNLERTHTLFDRIHDYLRICRCRICHQPYLEHFHDEIDWKDGNDRMWSTFSALSEEEHAMFARMTSDDAWKFGYFTWILTRPRLVIGPDCRPRWIH
jgi:hypothetical protein